MTMYCNLYMQLQNDDNTKGQVWLIVQASNSKCNNKWKLWNQKDMGT